MPSPPEGDEMMTPPSPVSPLEVYLLGLVEFEDVQALQRRLVYEFGEREGGALILCEHPPTITVGRSGSRAHIRADDEELRAWGVRVRWVNRGGGVVLHLPGQITAYAILPLAPLGLDVRGFVDGLHQAILDTLGEFDLSGSARPDAPGVFLGEERVASVGVAVNRWIGYHGLTLNVGPFLAPFGLLDEPGPGGRPLRQTSMEARRQRPAPMAKVREGLIRNVEQAFGLERHVLFTDHPMIRRNARTHAHAQSLH
jgi:lipoyl(octanoyl) transferase